MILTVTFNPSIDTLYQSDSFKIGSHNRFKNPIKMVGGKGINAGRTASILGSNVISTGILAGFNGKLINNLMDKDNFEKDFIFINGETRNAITIMHDQGIQTEIIEEGPYINSDLEKQILNKIFNMKRYYPNINVLCLSGSVNSKNKNLYECFIKKISKEFGKKIKILVDISGSQLHNVLKSDIKPYFVKPNQYEFSELLDININRKEDIIHNLKSTSLFDEIPLVIVSCGGEGAIARFGNDIYDLEIPKINLINPTGSGDATVGGVAYSIDANLDIKSTLKMAMASGVANAMETDVGFVRKENVLKIKEKIKVNKI